MADRVETRQVAVPPQTSQANAIQVDLSFAQGRVQEIEVVIPSGHAGVTGLAIAVAHQIVIPYSGSVWIVSDDETLRFAFTDKAGSGNWQAFAYNNDFANTHTFYLRFFIDELVSAEPASPVALPISAIAAAAPPSAPAATVPPVQAPQALGLIHSSGTPGASAQVPIAVTAEGITLAISGAEQMLGSGQEQIAEAETGGGIVTDVGTVAEATNPVSENLT